MPIQKFNNGQWNSLEESAFTDRSPEAFYPQDYSKLFKTALLGSGLFASGYIKTQKGNVWDKYVSALQHVEEYSPGGILRTFQLSTFFSQFQSMPEQGIFIGSDLLQKNNNYRAYLGTLIGQAEGAPSTHNRLIAEGVTFKEGKLFWGQSDEVALPFASAFRESDQVISRLGAGYAQALGFNPKGIKREKFFSTLEPKEGIFNPSFNNEVLQITGGHTRREALWRQMSAIGAESVNRFNRLLEAPFELEPFKTIFDSTDDLLEKYTGKRFKFAVNQSTPIKQLGALSLKYGAGLGLLGMGYSTLDWAAREFPLLNNTLFEEGITAGIATIGIEANLAVSRLAELTGLHRYREAQEEVAPGSTSLQKLLAFPLAGALLGSAGAYAIKVPRMAKLQLKEGLSPAAARQRIVEQVATFSDDNALSRLGKQLTSSNGFYQRDDWIGKTLKTIARPGSNKKLHFKLLGELGPVKLAGLVGATAGLATILPFLPGALIPSTRPEELERIYSGEQEVAIRKGRFWEFGRQSYEGEGIKYFRPHWYPRMIQRSKEKSIWGEDADDAPWSKFLRKEFTYELEAKHYEDRPYPISALPFQDIPLVGPLLANTLGRIIKPPQLMHEEEWMNAKGETLKPFGSFGAVSSATELGEKDPAQPVSPFSPKSILSEQVYRMTEMMGLPGYTLTTIKEHLTGTPDLFDQHMRLESANRIAGFEREYWDKDLGGMMGTSEVFRRLYPHKQNQVPLYNPIKNQMPDWLPGSGERGPDLQHGDAYSRIQEGEIRLPGEGYAARFPELKDVDPEDYPLIHKYKILSDVAPYTEKFKMHAAMVTSARKGSNWTEQNEAIYQQVQAQIKAKKENKTFYQYQNLGPLGELGGGDRTYYRGSDDSSGLLEALNREKTSARESPSLWQRFFGGYWEAISHNLETPLDYLTPISPGAKLVHMRSPIESYEKDVVFGTQNAFWDRPYENFLRPTANLIKMGAGLRDVPGHIKSQRNLEEYFDVLKYVKASRLANQAVLQNDYSSAADYERTKNETLFGVNPFTQNYGSIYRALPKRDKDYFGAFTQAETVAERERILSLVPENEQALYKARWQQQLAADIVKAKTEGKLSPEQSQAGDQMVSAIQEASASEGMPTSKELLGEYLQTRAGGESYPDWYRRTKLLPKYSLPAADWIGWDPRVDLEDVKLKVVMNLGEDMHDYNLWADRARTLANKPYIDDIMIQPIINQENLSDSEKQARINNILLTAEANNRYENKMRTIVNIEQDRDFRSRN